MTKFRKKPVVIDAVQWTGDLVSLPEAWRQAINRVESPSLSAFIQTLEGEHECRLQDWIIRGVQGEFYPCKPDIFAATYEQVGAMTDDAITRNSQQFEPKPGHGPDQNLPPLPEPILTTKWERVDYWDEEAMREYARAAVEMRAQDEADALLFVFEHGKKMARTEDAAASPWRTIDSAPKDGRWIIVTECVEWADARWSMGAWINVHGQRLEPTPTHWMPIPPLPEVKP